MRPRRGIPLPVLALALLLLAPLALAAGFLVGSILAGSRAIEGVEIRWREGVIQVPPSVRFGRERTLEDGARESVQLSVHADGEASVLLFRWGPNSSIARPNVSFRVDAAEARRIFDLAERSGLSRHDEPPPLFRFRMGNPTDRCPTRFSLGWVFRRGSRVYWYDDDFCAENAPPGAAPLLEALGRLADEGVRRAAGP